LKTIRPEKRKLFNALSASYPFKSSEAGLEDEFPGLLSPLKKAGFLQADQPGLEVICPALPNNCLVTAEPMNGRYYAHCGCSEEVGLVKIDAKQLRWFRFDLPAFLNWLISAALIDADFKEIESGELWHLGEKTLKGETTPAYFNRTRNADEVLGVQKEVYKDGNPPIIFWLGETPRRGQFPPNLLSLPEIVSVSERGFALNRKPLESLFKKRLILAAHGDIRLDDEIALRKKEGKCLLLFGQEKKNQFLHEAPIYPQDYNIIRHLYQIRRYQERAKTLAEMRDRGLAGQRGQISRTIKKINEICGDFNAVEIFHKFPDHKWGLNPILTCCNISTKR